VPDRNPGRELPDGDLREAGVAKRRQHLRQGVDAKPDPDRTQHLLEPYGWREVEPEDVASGAQLIASALAALRATGAPALCASTSHSRTRPLTVTSAGCRSRSVAA